MHVFSIFDYVKSLDCYFRLCKESRLSNIWLETLPWIYHLVLLRVCFFTSSKLDVDILFMGFGPFDCHVGFDP